MWGIFLHLNSDIEQYILLVMISQLHHHESHKFLTDIGFVARPLLGDNQRIAYDYPGSVSIVLNIDNKVTTFDKLYNLIVEQSYSAGREQGKNDAIGSIMKNLTKMIFDLK